MADYIALIHKDADSDFGVSVPDFPGCVTAGTTLDEARAMAAEALALHIEGMVEDGEAVPEPSSLTDIMRDRENRDAVAVLVPGPTRAAKAIRVNITLPEDALRLMDSYAEQHGLTRSGLILAATKRMMEAA
ncbi:type II toxin-antitoxin system HicB family antitoxin [Neoroseomonas lacus]|uniref:HicB family protein n=1 Tax=Neoroseomonas lacus TaxID=287609 RepID=A0A917NNS3_9PROT|nr:type II toxin-antitoxin system HicB family antitoxin [Neoroseomonas lacus]GGJ14412.1 HicB family protein [Neoroseomonas lacus]